MAGKGKNEQQVKTEKQSNNTLVYIGPTITGVVKEGTAFTSGLPESLKDMMKENPLLNRMVVSVNNLAEAMNEVRDSGSALNAIYNKILGGK